MSEAIYVLNKNWSTLAKNSSPIWWPYETWWIGQAKWSNFQFIEFGRWTFCTSRSPQYHNAWTDAGSPTEINTYKVCPIISFIVGGNPGGDNTSVRPQTCGKVYNLITHHSISQKIHLKFVPKGAIDNKISIGSGKGLLPLWWQAIT